MGNNEGIKIILLGESCVGKTNLINVAVGKSFEFNTESSLANSFVVLNIKIKNIYIV